MDGEQNTIEVGGEGPHPSVTKTAATSPGIARLRAEAAILTAARHPGVVALLDEIVDTDSGGHITSVRVRTRFAGSRTLGSIGPVDPTRAAGLIASLATTVADLHHIGIRHGRLTADHVIVASDGRPVLCGFSGASTSHDRAHPDADDVAGLGTLLRELVTSTDDMGEQPPDRLPWRRTSHSYVRGPLLNLADQATADDPARRPSARQFASAIQTTVPGATLAEVPVDEMPTAHRRSGFLFAGATGGVAVVVLGLLMWSGGGATTLESAPPPGPVSEVHSPPTAEPAPASPSPESRFAGAAGCVASTESDLAHLADGSPCPLEMSVANGLLTVERDAFGIGLASAAAALGDFECSGTVRPAVLDLSTGDVFLFDRWPSADEPVDATAVTRVDGPRQILADTDPRGCHRLVVLDEWGIRHIIDPTEATTP